MADEQVTPALLRADAERRVVEARRALCDEAAADYAQLYGGNPLHPANQRRYDRDVAAHAEMVDALIAAARAAAALEAEAARLEAGERVCRWGEWHTVIQRAESYEYWGRDTGCGGFVHIEHQSLRPDYCEHCGGRVVLGDEEASDE